MTTLGEHARHEALEYARTLVQRHRIACSWAECPGAGLVLRCLGLGGLWRRHTRVHAGLWLRRRTPEGGYLSTRERQEIAILGHRVAFSDITLDVLPALVLASLIHPDPPEGLLTVAALLMVEGVVEVVR